MDVNSRCIAVVFCVALVPAAISGGTEPSRAIMLVDDFEDCNVDGWVPVDGVCTAIATSINPGGGVCSMEIFNDCGGHYDGYYLDFGPFAADEISVLLKSQSTSMGDTAFVVGEQDGADFHPVVFLFASANGYWNVVEPGTGNLCGTPYTAYQWYNFVFTLDWSTKTYSVSRDGVTCVTGVDFYSDRATLNRIHAYNIDASGGWYDDIIMSQNPPIPPIFSDDFEDGTTQAWTATVS